MSAWHDMAGSFRAISLRLAALIALVPALAAPATAARLESRYTSIANSDCVIAPTLDEEVEEQSKTCLGPAGISVVVNGLGTSVQIALTWDETNADGAPSVVEAWSAGEKIEWRGPVVSGVFKAEAAVVRMLFPKEGTPDVGHQVLAIIRVEYGEACLLGAVDIGANKNGYELARSAADNASQFQCDRDSAVAIGKKTEWTRRVIEASGG